ncbi:hypothetical protein [Rhodohalobacter sp.]|uniref:hypothetical protein n=1 Tax=Rhodohalobacter sp. TaxID=1974210 RepID=UPI002ACE699F|nr:hypothetical protein [Rhodohalobacter sp.]MDZ7757375.1 hypothetical protein [Rhodohalobacter sp.]
MKLINTFSNTVGIFLIVAAIINFGCNSHFQNSLSDSDRFQQKVMIQYTPTSPDYLIENQLSDSLSLNQSFADSSDLFLADELIENVDWEHRQSSPDVHRVTFEITHNADSVSTEIFACDQTWENVIHCSDTAHFVITAMKGERTVTYRDSINLKLLNELFVQERSEN